MTPKKTLIMKHTTIPFCVGVVTVTTVVTQPGTRTYFKSSYGFATALMTAKRRKAIANEMKDKIRDYVLKNKEAYGINSKADVKFYAGVKILECDGIIPFK